MTSTEDAGVLVPLQSGRALSPMQRSLWASQLNHPEQPVQNMPLLSVLHGPVDPQRLAAAFDTVVAQSDVLRTRLVDSAISIASHSATDNPTASATHSAAGRWLVELIPAATAPTSEIVEVPAADVDRWARTRVANTIDLTICGYDSAIAVHEDGSASWYLNLHHVITDATSSALVFEATAAVYQGQSTNEPSGDTRLSYYRWSRSLAAELGEAKKSPATRALDYWQQREVAPRIGRLYQSADRDSVAAERLSLPIGPELLADAERRLGGDYRMLTDDLGWSTLLTTTTALYLHRTAGADRFAVGLPVHNRSRPDTRSLIGPTMEVFPVDITIARDDTFRSLHRRVGRAILNTLRYAIPGTSPAADYEAVVNVIPRATQEWFGDIAVTTRWLHSGAIDGSHLLRVQMTSYSPGSPSAGSDDRANESTEQGPEFALDLNHGGADADHRMRASGHFVSLLSELVADPDAAIATKTVCSPGEIDLLRRWEHGPIAETRTAGIVERLEAALASNDETVLVEPVFTDLDPGPDRGPDRELTGAEAWSWAIDVAKHLTELGVEPGQRVAVRLPRSIEAVVAIYGVMVAGCSFVPLDPTQPLARTNRLAERAGCTVVLSSVEEIAAARSPIGSVTVGAAAERDPADEAYLLFTSGSTGEPKGVPITVGALTDYIEFAESAYCGDPTTAAGPASITAALFSPLTFDLTITSLFMPVVAGGRLVVVEPDGPRGLSIIAGRPEINWCKATPSHLEILVRLLGKGHNLQTLVVGGEAFGSRLASALLAFNPELRIFNEYGPTEAVVGCMLYEVEPELLDDQADVPIGKPAPGVTLRIVDEYLKRVPIGSPGELCIAHPGLTSGYLNADDGPDSPFIELEGQRFYRSGDLVRLQDPQRLVYLGRRDAQIKVGGIRLEPIEVEDVLNSHPRIERSAVRLWSPQASNPTKHCLRCGLPDNIPGVEFDTAGICETCHAYERVAPITQSWFKTPDDLVAKLEQVRSARTGQYDCLHLLSGGKDSTYALYKLVELGFRPYALTLDNGFISEGAKENSRRSVADLGIDHEFATTESMNAIFRDSLDRYSNVCHGCYKTIYTLATTRAAEIGAPMIVTGLSRGQLFETRLIPQQFSAERFDPDAIDRAVISARKVYHRVDDGPNRLLNTKVFENDDVFEQIEYLDIYRYLDVELSDLLRFLDERAPWVRPSDTGRSTNCLINAAGIHTHQIEQGYHNYAVPYAWDVRLGHKTRNEAIEELDDQLDREEVESMLSEVGYEPRPRQILTAWIQPTDSNSDSTTLDPGELRSFLARSLPSHAIPSAFVEINEIPLSDNGKLDDRALPAPKRVHRPGPTLQLTAEVAAERADLSELQLAIVELWEQVLQIEPVALDDDFFALGGDSLAALEMIVALAERTGRTLGEDLAFTNSTPAQLATAIELLHADGSGAEADLSDPVAFAATVQTADDATGPDEEQGPPLSAGELAVLFEQATKPDEVMYNVGRLYVVEGPVDAARFEQALRAVAARHEPLSWSYASPRRPLQSHQAVSVEAFTDVIASDEVEPRFAPMHRAPFDLTTGPLLRCALQPVDNGSTAILLVIHHGSGDAGSFSRLWSQLNDELTGAAPAELPLSYSQFAQWQAVQWQTEQWQTEQQTGSDSEFWLNARHLGPAASLAVYRPDRAEPDGFITATASITAEQLRTGNAASAASVALGAVAATVRCFSDGPAIELGLITSTRNHEAAENLFGYFLNTVPVQLRCDGQQSSAEIARQASAAIGGALAHRTYPLAKIVADRQAAGLALPKLDVFMAFDELDAVDLEGTTAEQRVLSNGDAVAPLTFFVELRGGRVELSLEHRGSVIGASTAEQMLTTFDRLLRAAVTDPERSLTELVTEQGVAGAASLMIGPAIQSKDEGAALVINSIVDRLNAGGSMPAVVCGDTELSWQQTAIRAEAIRAALHNAGVQRGDRVVLCLPRSADLIPVIVGIQLAGAAYVPIDPSYPADRIALTIGKAGAVVGVVGPDQRSLVDKAIVITGAIVSHEAIVIDRQETPGIDQQPWPTASDAEPMVVAYPDIDQDDPAYVIFTSGSTGEPRGVSVSHANLAASNGARAGVYDSPPERFLMLSSVAFDSSIVGLFWTLAAGGAVVLPTETQAHDLSAIVSLLRSGVSHSLMVPTLYQGLLRLATGGREPQAGLDSTRFESAGFDSAGFDSAGLDSAGLDSARLDSARLESAEPAWADHVIVAGEACPAGLVAAHFDHFPESNLTNEYGPTEATVWATAHHCQPGDNPVPIGPAIPGSWLAVIDTTGAIVTAGVEGELIVGGPGIVDGYLDEPTETAKRFGRIPAEYQPVALRTSSTLGDGRYFLTGDRAVLIDRELRFLGRGDDQLNVGGARVEPEEVERVLLGLDGVTAAVVVAVDMRPSEQLLAELPAEVVGPAMATAAAADEPYAALLTELRTHGSPDLRLVAHLETSSTDRPEAFDLAEVRSLVAAQLPPLMRPAFYGIHDQLPVTPNGKLDRQQAALLPVAEPATQPGPATTDSAMHGQQRHSVDELAGELTQLMAQALRAPTFGADDSFFDHGGHSLLAMELLLSIEDRFGKRLPAAALYDAATPTELARLLGSDREAGASGGTAASEPRSFLVPIQRDGSLAPIFAVHVLGIDCAYFRPLSAQLGTDQPMYGLGQPTSSLDTSGPTDVADVAAAYAAEIHQVAPTGPISLAAISLGGVVAFELAQQLIDQGREVALLALFDAYGPETEGLTPSLEERVASTARRAVTTPRQYWTELADRQGQKLQRAAERAALKARERLNLRTDHQLEVRRFIEANISSQVKYAYEPYPGPMLVIKAADHPFADLHVERRMGWSGVAAGELTITTATGEHLSIMEEPHVAQVATAMRALLPSAPPGANSPQVNNNRDTVERMLIAALKQGRLPSAMSRIEQWSGLSDDANELLADTDRVMRGLSDGTRAVADEVVAHLTQAGLSANAAAVPNRLAHGTASITLGGNPDSDLATLLAAMAEIGFYEVGHDTPTPIMVSTLSNNHLDFVRRQAVTSRLRVSWLQAAPGANGQPNTGNADRLANRAPAGLRQGAAKGLEVVRQARWNGRGQRAAKATDLGIYLGTSPALIEPLLRFAGIERGDVVVDIGCGDGRVLIEAAAAFGCTARGYEIDEQLVDLARRNVRAAGLDERVEIVLGDAAEVMLTGIDLVFAFLPPEAVASLLEPTLQQLPAEARFLSHEQLGARLPIEPDRQGLIVGSGPSGIDGGITVANLWHGRRGRR